MTFGQMKILTDKFNQIKGASQKLKYKHFDSMLHDLVKQFPAGDKHARQMYVAVLDEMEV